MKLGILETGDVNPEMLERHGPLAPLFERFFRLGDPDLAFASYKVLDGVFPAAVDACDAWVITGSKHGVYDDLPWIAPLKAFIRDAYAARIPLIGVCFGHQIMAEALGGRAEKFSRGWSVGAQTYAVANDPAWLGHTPPGAMTLHAFHQDQVTALPPEARPIAASEFCANAALAYGPSEAPRAISVQGHPEFSAAFVEGLLDLRAGVSFSDETANAARAGLGGAVDDQTMADWFVAFLRQATARRGGVAQTS